MQHSPGFLQVVEAARAQVHEVDVEQTRALMRSNPAAVLLDVREDHEWQAGHAEGAEHLGRGILERDIERRYPDRELEIVMVCGGGYRSVLACEVAQRMGYRRVHSLIGGFKALEAAGWPVTR